MANEIKKNADVLTHQLESVNSSDYWLFRNRRVEKTTHADFTVQHVVKNFPTNEEITPQNIVAFIRKTWDNEKCYKAAIGSDERQILQYLGQLTQKGWNGLVNKIRLQIDMKRRA